MSADVVSGGTIARGLGGADRVKWPLVRSSDLFELRYGRALVASSRHPGTVPVYGTNGQTGTHDEALFTGPGVVVGRKGAGHLGVHWSETDYWVIDTAYSLVPSSGIDLKFAYYMINYVGLNHLKHGTSNPSLTRDAFGAQYFPVPPLSAQRHIAATLGALDDKIESNRRTIDIAEALGDAIFTDTAAMAAAVSEVAKLSMGSSPPGTSYNEEGTGTPFYQGVRDFGRRYPARRVWTTDPIRLAEPNDTLVSVRAPVGDLNRTYEICCVGRGVASVRSKSASTIYYALRAASNLWEPFQQEGTVFGAINRADLAAAKIPWPEVDELLHLEARLSAIDARIESLSREISALTALRDALLPELLSGRTRIPDAVNAITREVPEMENA